MNRVGERGAVTVFLSMIVLSVIILAGVLVDAARIRTAETQVNRAVESAARSALAGFDNLLKEQYGIFALHINDASRLEEIIAGYIEENLVTEPGDNTLNLYDYRIEEVKVTPIYNLTENEVTRNQVVEYMKYRAPKQMVDGFLNKVRAVSDTGKVTAVTELKMDIDKLYLDIEKYRENLHGKLKDVNSFNYKQFRQEYTEPYAQKVREYRECLKEIKALEKRIQMLLKENWNSTALKDEKEKLRNLHEKLTRLKGRKDTAFESMCHRLEGFRTYNSEAKTLAIQLGRSMEEIRDKVACLRDYLEGEVKVSSSQYLKEYKDEVEKSLDSIEKDIPEQKDIDNATANLEFNLTLLDTAYNKVSDFDKRFGDSINSELADVTSSISDRLGGLESYRNDTYIGFKAKMRNGGSRPHDPRKDAAKGLRDQMYKGEDKDNPLKINLKSLPSYKENGNYPNKLGSPDFTCEDGAFRNEHGISREISGADSAVRSIGEADQGILHNLQERASFEDNTSFSKDAFRYVKNLCSEMTGKIQDSSTALRNELYVNEYIMGTFSNFVPSLDDKTDMKFDLRGNIKERVVDGEVEYILWGGTSEKKNLNMVRGQILLIRFAVDTANVYRQPEKVEAAFAIAAASSAWSFGLSTPFVQNLILCSWGMIDAVNDLNALMKGEQVPLFRKYTAHAETDKGIKFSYHDYLRVFLLIQPPEQKMNRIEDLIQVRTGEELYRFNTCLRIEAAVSVKYLFLTQPFMPGHMKTPDGTRHRFKVLVYQGY